MRLAGNIGSAVGGADGGGDARETNRVVKFGLFCGRTRQSFCKIGRWILGFLI